MKHKIGDKVKVRSDLELGKWYGSNTFEYSMIPWRGAEVTIAQVPIDDLDDEYSIEEDHGYWGWTGEMFKHKGADQNG